MTTLEEVEARWSNSGAMEDAHIEHGWHCPVTRRGMRCECLREELGHAPEDIAWLVARVKELEAQKNAAYTERNKLVALLARIAQQDDVDGYYSGKAEHDSNDAAWDSDWRCIVFVDTPEGQLSWHMHDSERRLVERLPRYPRPWDGHTTEEKYERIERLVGAR